MTPVTPDSQLLIDRFRAGEPTAAQSLLDRYAERLRALARSRLSRQLSRRLDADDIVQSALASFFRRAEIGEFRVEREGDLWRLLAAITLRKLWRQAKHHRAAKRSIAREEFAHADESLNLEQLASREPAVSDVIIAADELRVLLVQLSPSERQIIQLQLDDVPAPEIAARLDCSTRTVPPCAGQSSGTACGPS